MTLDLLINFHSFFYIIYLVALFVLITKGEKISKFFEKQKPARVRAKAKHHSTQRQKQARFIP